MRVPHFKQSKDGYCLPACVRMVLGAYGHTYTESSLVQLFDTTSVGTPASRITRLKTRGFYTVYDEFSEQKLPAFLSDGIYPIVFVKAEYLSWATFRGSHAVVITDIQKQQLALHDPALDKSPIWVTFDEFMIAWIEFDQMAGIIYPKGG